MVDLIIPGFGELHLNFLVLDFNGTLALDGVLLKNVSEKLIQLASVLEIHVITSDTFNTVTSQMADLPVRIKILSSQDHTHEKADFVEQLGAQYVIAAGNGSNDSAMLRKAAIGIAVVQNEGTSVEAITNANLVFSHISDALDAIMHPQRLVASLRK